ncbi:MAG: methyltransferase [Gemmatimonas sp.]|nr:methyltransferase [Gemmatimonas sp.]
MRPAAVLRLRKDEDRRLRAGHLWVFSNEIDVATTPLDDIEPGQAVELQDARGNFVAWGYANPHSLITARILSRRRDQPLGADLVAKRLGYALSLRERLFPQSPFYRLCFGESDGLPGLVVDRYGSYLVVQPTTAGMERSLDEVLTCLTEMLSPDGIVVRADSPLRRHEGLDLYSRIATGNVPESVEIMENGVRFRVPVLLGQKTGWFYDHRRNRARLRDYVAGTRVLDVFSYVGGWGVQAAVFGAREVVCVDASTAALAELRANADLNGVSDRVQVVEGDAFESLERLESSGNRFDFIVLDPPAFIKRKKDLKKGEQAYRRLNRVALTLLAADGVLMSASCSFHLGRDAFLRAILWAAGREGREIQVIEEGHQGPDHPIHPAIPETNYLKAFFVRTLS